MNLEEVLKRPEGKTLEFKRAIESSEPLLRSVVAFANTAGGTLLVGVEDKTRHVTGVADALALEERLANLVSDHIRPQLVPEIEILPWRRTQVVALQVYPSSSRPHYLKSAGPDQGVFVRVGSTNRRADRTMVEELRRLVRIETFDEQPMTELNSEALDFRAASELFAPGRRITQRDLKTLRLVAEHQGHLRPTVGGILLFGLDREQWFPDAWIQAGRFQGKDRSHILDTVDIRSYPAKAVEEALSFVLKHETRGLIIEGARHVEQWSVPPSAVREAVINAVVHADYAQRGAPVRLSVFEDRLEVENPGLLPFGLTIEDLRQGISKLRNRVIGRVFRELGLIEQWGSGIGRMIAACRDAGLPEPQLEEIGWHFRVTFSKQRGGQKNADLLEMAILDVLRDGHGHATSEIAHLIGKSPRTARTRLAGLVERGLVIEIGSAPRDPRRKYHLAKQR